MLTLDVLIQPHLSPAASIASDRAAAREVPLGGRGLLRIYDCPGEVLMLGRYHLLPQTAPDVPIRLHRRISGGRALPFGDGFIGVSLVLPHRSALVSSDPLALRPDQVLNRCVRGVMAACRSAGVNPIYPGRDWLTINRRPFALVSMEMAGSGALIFEAVIANARAFSVLPEMLDRADPSGMIKAEMIAAESVTSVAAAVGQPVDTEQFADLVRHGYEREFGVDTVITQASLGVADSSDSTYGAWLAERRDVPRLNYRSCTRTQLGLLEVHAAVNADEQLVETRLIGDFIANFGAVAQLERGLRGCKPIASEVRDAVFRVFTDPSNFILGIGSLEILVETIRRLSMRARN